MKKKDLIIFVPGAKYVYSKYDFLERAIRKFYELTNILNPIRFNYALLWQERLRKTDNEVIWLHWNGGVNLISKFFAVRRLKRIINHYHSTHNIKLVGLSLGGEIVLEAAQKLPSKIQKIVLLCSTNEHIHQTIKVPIYNLYSPDDLFEKFSAFVLSPFHGGVRIYGEKVKNIILAKLRHEDFCKDSLIRSGKYKGLKVSEVVKLFL